ncbi:hypothetical protein ACP275_12G099100 [Erythranthe tilingii]
MSSHHRRPSLWGILSETWRITTAQPRHYAALSILFVLPVTFSPVIYPFLLRTISVSITQTIVQIIVYYLLVLLLGLLAAVSITYATFRGFCGKPARLISSLRSILVSFLPLLGTKLVCLVFLVWAIGGLLIAAYNVLLIILLLSGFEKDYCDRYLPVSVFTISVVLVATTYIVWGWCLMAAVVVVESQWGLAALGRCWDLTKGVRCISFSMVIFFGVLSVILSMWCSVLVIDASRNGVSCLVVVQMIVCVGLWTVLSVYSTAASTVLFVHCKAFHGEDTAAFPIVDEELGPEYAPLTLD